MERVDRGLANIQDGSKSCLSLPWQQARQPEISRPGRQKPTTKDKVRISQLQRPCCILQYYTSKKFGPQAEKCIIWTSDGFIMGHLYTWNIPLFLVDANDDQLSGSFASWTFDASSSVFVHMGLLLIERYLTMDFKLLRALMELICSADKQNAFVNDEAKCNLELAFSNYEMLFCWLFFAFCPFGCCFSSCGSFLTFLLWWMMWRGEPKLWSKPVI